MNIFVLDENPKVAAQMHCDKHVCKMSIEYAQLLSTAHHIHNTDIAQTGHIYKPTHAKHPATLWVSAHPLHYAWVFELMRETWNEYTYRYQRVHASSRLLSALQIVPNMGTIVPNMGTIEMPTAPPQCMPNACKVSGNSWQATATAYRQYYMIEKRAFATWKTREIPTWFMPQNCVDSLPMSQYNISHETKFSSLGR